MNRFNQILVLLIVLQCFACGDGELPEPMTGTPVFSFNGTIDGATTLLNAGDDDFFMFTEFEEDDQNVFSYIGRLAKLQPDCEDNCNEQLRILIRNNQTGTPNAAIATDALVPGFYEYDDNGTEADTLTRFVVQYDNQSATSDPSARYLWSFPGNTFEGETPPADTLVQLGFSVGLEVTMDTLEFCTSSVIRQVSTNAIINCGISFEVTASPGSTSLGLLANVSGTPPFDYMWQNGIDSSMYIADSVGQHCVTITDASGCASFNCLEFVNDFPFSKSYCSAAFDYQIQEFTEITGGDLLRLSEVRIEYTDSTGNLYSSILGAQAVDSFFEITRSDDFDDNENGEATKQLGLRFKALLYDTTGVSIPIESDGAVIGVAYPR
ncbi:MAG: hypothetical protein AAF985_02725 [Bacteroidota bacterium]